MLKLEDLRKDAAVSGIEPGQVVRILTAGPGGYQAVTVYYKIADGQTCERMHVRTDEPGLSLAKAARPWALDALGEELKLAAEGYRISLAHLSDPMMAIHTSNVEPLPHEILNIAQNRPTQNWMSRGKLAILASPKRKSRRTKSQIVKAIRAVEGSRPVKSVCRSNGASEVAYYAWKSNCGGVEVVQHLWLRKFGTGK